MLQAREWREAMRVAWQAGKGELVANTISPAAADAADAMLQEVQEDLERLHKYSERLKEVPHLLVVYDILPSWLLCQALTVPKNLFCPILWLRGQRA